MRAYWIARDIERMLLCRFPEISAHAPAIAQALINTKCQESSWQYAKGRRMQWALCRHSISGNHYKIQRTAEQL